MSKTQFKKEIAAMDREQLVGLLLEAYDARKETKEYFEFFLNPDIDALAEKFRKKIAKEFAREKRRYCRARISNVKGAIRDFASFQPGDEHVLDLYIWTIRHAMAAEKRVDFPESLIKSLAGLLSAALAFADKALLADKAMAAVESLLSDTAAGTIYMRRSLSDNLVLPAAGLK